MALNPQVSIVQRYVPCFLCKGQNVCKKPIALGPACKPLHPVQIKNTLHNNCMCGRSAQLQQDNAGPMTDHLGIYLIDDDISTNCHARPKIPKSSFVTSTSTLI